MRFLAPAFAVAALMTAIVMDGPALAQQPPVRVPQAAQASPQGTQDTPAYTDADARAVLNARLAALKAVVDTSPEQERLWAPLETAIRDANRRAVERRDARRAGTPPATFLEVLGRIADAEAARGADLRRFVDAATPFVASLTDAQRRRVPAFLGMTHADQPSAELWLFEEEEG